jgi:hypothetical protein
MNRRWLIALLVTGVIVAAGVAGTTLFRAAPPKDCGTFFGVATMKPDRTISIRFRVPLPDCRGGFGEGIKEYKPGDPYYDEVLQHIGGLQPGETKEVPPWPDEPEQKK